MKKQAIIMAVIIIAVVAIGVILASKSGNNSGGNQAANNSPAADPKLLIKPDSHQTNPGAKVTFVEFGDYQCPACGAAYPAVKQITDQYKNDKNFNFVFRNFPLPMHPFAQIAAEAAEAAGAQGKYWEMHDQLYINQNDWVSASNPLDKFVLYAQAIGLDTNKFKQDIQNNAYQNKITADQNDGKTLGIQGTPTFYVNGKLFYGANPQDIQNEIANDLK